MNPNGMTLCAVEDVPGLYADAFVADQTSGELWFASFWGRDTTVQELLAKLTLPPSEGGLDHLRLVDCDHHGRRWRLSLFDASRLSKHTGRMPKGNLFGDAVQVWLFDRRFAGPDPATRSALKLFRATTATPTVDDEAVGDAVWALVKEVCHLPLLEHWRPQVMAAVIERGWVAMHLGVGVHAVRLDLSSEEVEPMLGGLIRQGRLVLTPAGDQSAASATTPAVPSRRLSAGELESALHGFTGTTKWFKHALNPAMLYTEGVQFFAQQGGQQGAYWFLDLVATEVYPLLERHRFLVIELMVNDCKATVRTENGAGNVLATRDIDHTDLQPGTWKYYLTDDVLLLPSEY